MSLIRILQAQDRALGQLTDLAIVGTAKNVGKTTTLNYLLERLAGQGALGLTSVGRDGEEYDAVTDLPKPRVQPPVGTLVATARIAAERSRGGLAFVSDTPYRTALGAVCIYRVAGPVPIEVAGPVSAADTAGVIAQLRDLGAHRVLVDGAIDRKASASRRVAQAVVLATGLAMLDEGGGRLGPGPAGHPPVTQAPPPQPQDPRARIAEVTRRTRAIVRMLALPRADREEGDVVGPADRTGARLKGGAFLPWQGGTTLTQSELLVRWLPPEAEALVLAGALTEDVAQALLRSARRDLALVVPDGTHVLCMPSTFERLEARGVVLQAREPISVLAVTANPTAPYRPTVDAGDLLSALRQALPLPVFDLVAQP